MKIALTGALGHIGSKLIRELPVHFPQVDITMIDNLATQRYCSLFNLPRERSYRFVEADVLTADLKKILKDVEVVIHMAAITNAAGSFEIREKIERENLNCTANVAKACLEVGASMINFSSTSVYGTQKEVVDEECSEEDLKPQSPYAETKLREERLLQELGIKQGLNFVTCRFGTIFGVSPGMRFHTAVNKFCWQSVMGQPVTVWRTAFDQKRPYLDLKDAVRAVHFIIDKGLFNRKTYNVLTRNFTVNEIVSAIKVHVPELKVEFVDTQIMNQLSYHVDNSRFMNEGFAYCGELQSGIAETIALLRSAHHSK